MEKEYFKIGKKKVINGVTYICPDYFSDGMSEGCFYKDEEAFENNPNEVCYVPEAAFDFFFEDSVQIDGEDYYKVDDNMLYTRKDFEKLIGDYIELGELDVDEDNYPTVEGCFQECLWLCPETWLEGFDY